MELKENTSSVDSQFFGIVNTNAHKEQISTIVDSRPMVLRSPAYAGLFRFLTFGQRNFFVIYKHLIHVKDWRCPVSIYIVESGTDLYILA